MVSSVQIGEPRSFGWREVAITNAICAVPALALGACVGGAIAAPVLACLVVKYQPLLALTGTQVVTLLLVLLTIGASAVVVLGLGLFFWPAAMGNSYMRRIAGRCLGGKPSAKPSYVCQVSLLPRLHAGFRGFIEDADDVGHLWITDEVLNFVGDHLRIALPLGSIQGVSSRNVGNRGLWVAGRRITIATGAVEGISSLEFLERQSGNVVSSQRISAAIIRQLMQKTQQASGDSTALSGL